MQAEEEKREKILRAALEEFANYGYEMASTNRITAGAGVAKGLLFHYFGSKKDLYLQVLDLCIENFTTKLEKKFSLLSDDVLERLLKINQIKLELAAEEPLQQEMLTSAFINPSAELAGEIKKRHDFLLEKYMPYITENINWDKFKPDINRGKALELVIMVTNALGDKYVEMYKQQKKPYSELMQQFTEELNLYFALIKNGIYR